MLSSGRSEESPPPAPKRPGRVLGALKEEGGRRRKRPGHHDARGSASSLESPIPKDPKPFKEPFPRPPGAAPKIPCRHPGVINQRCLAVGSRAWAPGREGWMEPNPQSVALDQGEKPRGRGGRRKEGGSNRRQQESPPTSEPKATTRCYRPRLQKLYTKGPLLGRGGYGSVYAGSRKSDGMPVAIKYVSKAQAEEELDIPGLGGPLPLEVALMMQVTMNPCCPYVLQMLDWFDQPTRYVMVLECPEPCQDLVAFCQDQGGFVSESMACHITTQLLKALRHSCERGVLHRDVKPENLLIQTDSLQVKLIDFGCGDLLKNTMYKDFAGTLEYSPPEWFLRGQYLAGPATVWSVGVTLFNLVCGFLPFNSIGETIRGRVTFPRGISAECRHLIRWCLSTKAADRPTLEQIQLHNWLTLEAPPTPQMATPTQGSMTKHLH